MSGFTALVLAGSRGPSDPVAVAAGASHKALAEVGGVPMLVRVVRALAAAGAARVGVSIERPDVVADLAELHAIAGCAVEAIQADATPSLSVRTAMDRLGAPLLVTTGDHALLRPEWISWFLEHLPDADVVASAATAEIILAAQPDTRRTWLRFADLRISGCNLFYLRSSAAEGAVAAWRRFEAHRKDPLKLAQMLGPGALVRYAAGTLSLDDALARLGKLAGCRAGLVLMPFGAAAIDVDKPSDLELARRLAS